VRQSSQQGPDRRILRRVFVVLGVLCLGLLGAVTVYLLRDTSLGTPADDALRAAAASTTPQVMADAGVPSAPPARPGAPPIRTPRPTRRVPPTATSTVTRRAAPTRTPRPPLRSTPSPTAAPSPASTASLPAAAGPANRTVIGDSVLGRPLEVTQFGNGPIERMIIAGIHGGTEINTIELADQLIEYISSHPDIIPPNVTLFVLRALNPDGEAKGRVWSARGNANGVDLNRNFPALWENEWNRDGCWDYMTLTSGSGPGSEPETQALMSFLLARHVDALINYHSSALGIFAGGQPPDSESRRLAQAIGEMSEYPYPPIDTGCRYSGQLIDWASNHGIAAIDVELSNELDTDFEQNLAILAVLLSWQPESQ
jgi:hypothetical protein